MKLVILHQEDEEWANEDREEVLVVVLAEAAVEAQLGELLNLHSRQQREPEM